MKVNEVVNEGFWDSVKAGAAAVRAAAQQKNLGAGVNAYKDSKLNSQATTANKSVQADANKQADWAFTQWTQYAAKLPKTRLSTPQGYKQELDNYLRQAFRNKNFNVEDAQLSVQPGTNVVSLSSVKEYLKQALLQRDIAPGSNSAAGSTQPQQSSAAQNVKKSYEMPTVIHNEPDVIRYGNVDYTMNDGGKWSMMTKPDKVVPDNMQSLFNKVVDRSTGVVDTTQQAFQKPTPPEDIIAPTDVEAKYKADRQAYLNSKYGPNSPDIDDEPDTTPMVNEPTPAWTAPPVTDEPVFKYGEPIKINGQKITRNDPSYEKIAKSMLKQTPVTAQPQTAEPAVVRRTQRTQPTNNESAGIPWKVRL